MPKQQNPVYAVIDIGSNSTRLLLARDQGGQVDVLEKRAITTRIGEKMTATGRLSPEGMARTLKAIAGYVEAAHAARAAHIFLFATSAVREASNQEELLTMCRRRFWLSVDVIDGNKEALVSYLGAAPFEGENAVLDIGGGSTEISMGREGRLLLMGSLPMGAVRAKEMFSADERGLKQLYRQLPRVRLRFWQQLAGGEAKETESNAKDFLNRVKKCKGTLYGVGGTVTTLCALSDGLSLRYDPRVVHGRTMTRGEVGLVARELDLMSPEKRASLPLLQGRDDIIRHGASILMACMDGMGATSIIVSDSDNLEGYLLYQLKKNDAKTLPQQPAQPQSGQAEVIPEQKEEHIAIARNNIVPVRLEKPASPQPNPSHPPLAHADRFLIDEEEGAWLSLKEEMGLGVEEEDLLDFDETVSREERMERVQQEVKRKVQKERLRRAKGQAAAQQALHPTPMDKHPAASQEPEKKTEEPPQPQEEYETNAQLEQLRLEHEKALEAARQKEAERQRRQEAHKQNQKHELPVSKRLENSNASVVSWPSEQSDAFQVRFANDFVMSEGLDEEWQDADPGLSTAELLQRQLEQQRRREEEEAHRAALQQLQQEKERIEKEKQQLEQQLAQKHQAEQKQREQERIQAQKRAAAQPANVASPKQPKKEERKPAEPKKHQRKGQRSSAEPAATAKQPPPDDTLAAQQTPQTASGHALPYEGVVLSAAARRILQELGSFDVESAAKPAASPPAGQATTVQHPADKVPERTKTSAPSTQAEKNTSQSPTTPVTISEEKKRHAKEVTLSVIPLPSSTALFHQGADSQEPVNPLAAAPVAAQPDSPQTTTKAPTKEPQAPEAAAQAPLEKKSPAAEPPTGEPSQKLEALPLEKKSADHTAIVTPLPQREQQIPLPSGPAIDRMTDADAIFSRFQPPQTAPIPPTKAALDAFFGDTPKGFGTGGTRGEYHTPAQKPPDQEDPN